MIPTDTSPIALFKGLDLPKQPSLIQSHIIASAIDFKSGAIDEALQHLDAALALYPDEFTQPKLWQAKAVLLTVKKEYEHAHIFASMSLSKDKQNADYMSQIGVIYMQQHDYTSARYWMMKAMQKEATEKVLTNMGVLQIELGQPENAILYLRRALARNPKLPEAHWNMALARMSCSLYDQDTWMHHEYRFLTHASSGYNTYTPPFPLWRGEPLTGKVLFIKTEQGKGDTLKYMRYISFVRAMGADVIISCDNDMLPLLKIVFSDCMFVENDTPFYADYWIWLMSIGQFWDGIPTHTPYVVANECEFDDYFRVGVCWHGNSEQGDDWKRSIFDHSLIDLILTIQKEVNYNLPLQSLQYGENFNSDDWMETADVIEQCDLIITVDTSIAHLAGAMHKPTWVLLSASPSYHYPIRGTTNPWYPSQRLYRQEGIENITNWKLVLEKIGQDLRQLLQSRR